MTRTELIALDGELLSKITSIDDQLREKRGLHGEDVHAWRGSAIGAKQYAVEARRLVRQRIKDVNVEANAKRSLQGEITEDTSDVDVVRHLLAVIRETIFYPNMPERHQRIVEAADSWMKLWRYRDADAT